MISKTKKKISDDIQKETKDLKRYMDQQFKKSNLAIQGVQSDLVNTSQEFKSIKHSGTFNQRDFENFDPNMGLPRPQNNITLPI